MSLQVPGTGAEMLSLLRRCSGRAVGSTARLLSSGQSRDYDGAMQAIDAIIKVAFCGISCIVMLIDLDGFSCVVGATAEGSCRSCSYAILR